MNDDQIQLPPEFRSSNEIPVERATIKRERMIEILREAIESDRRQRSEPIGYLVPRGDGLQPFYVPSDRTVRDAHIHYGWQPLYTAPQPLASDDRSDHCKFEGCAHKKAGSPVWEKVAEKRTDAILDALKEMQRFFGKWPEFVPADQHIGTALKAVRKMNAVLSDNQAHEPSRCQECGGNGAGGEHEDDCEVVAEEASFLSDEILIVLNQAEESLGRLVSDEGWGQKDMCTLDNLSALIAKYGARK